jgi:hypothetical protein
MARAVGISRNLATGSCSALLRQQPVELFTMEAIDIEPILREIGCLEGIMPAKQSSTKSASTLNREPVKGPFHKHYIEAGSMNSMIL